LIVAPLTKDSIDSIQEGWGHNHVYRKGEITSLSDMMGAKKGVKYHKEDESYEPYVETRYGNSWGRGSQISEGRFSLDELKQNYGILKRVYKNGFKKEI